MWLALAAGLGCAGPAPVAGALGERGTHRLAVSSEGGHWTVSVGLADGRPEESAELRVTALDVDGRPVGTPIVDPGECDDIGPDRCFHPGGRYRLSELPPTAAALRVVVRGGAGEDEATLPLR